MTGTDPEARLCLQSAVGVRPEVDRRIFAERHVIRIADFGEASPSECGDQADAPEISVHRRQVEQDQLRFVHRERLPLILVGLVISALHALPDIGIRQILLVQRQRENCDQDAQLRVTSLSVRGAFCMSTAEHREQYGPGSARGCNPTARQHRLLSFFSINWRG